MVAMSIEPLSFLTDAKFLTAPVQTAFGVEDVKWRDRHEWACSLIQGVRAVKRVGVPFLVNKKSRAHDERGFCQSGIDLFFTLVTEDDSSLLLGTIKHDIDTGLAIVFFAADRG